MSLCSDMVPNVFVLYLLFVLLFRLFDDNVLGSPHLCGSDIKSLKL